MKKVIFILTISFIVLSDSRGQKQTGNSDLIKVDVRKNYSQKRELILQDFMDVEYIALETKDDFYNQGVVMDVGKEVIIVKNRINDGDIFVYSRTGKALRKINRMGKGPEEYILNYGITLDEGNGEMFINDMPAKKILVYDLYGKFKRVFKHKVDSKSYFSDIFNYDGDHLICYDQFNEEIPFVLISKQDGSITKEIKIPFNNKKSLVHHFRDGEIINTVTPGPYRKLITFKGNWMLSEISADTVYTFFPDYSLRPFLVRTPSVQSMDPEVMLHLRFFSDRYIFMETVKNVFDFNNRKGFPKAFFMYDRQEKAFFEYNVYNGDYSTKKEIYMNALRPVNHEIESWQSLDAEDLVESYKKGELKGRLKEIAATLEEESNPVIMLVKHKK
ncbi:MAG: 6-bladed beta-propeller [Bacteroidales bacterium]|nr:6-bladed beta-propeller [Bacteroidales bacterium]